MEITGTWQKIAAAYYRVYDCYLQADCLEIAISFVPQLALNMALPLPVKDYDGAVILSYTAVTLCIFYYCLFSNICWLITFRFNKLAPK